MNTTHTTRFLSVLMALATTALMLSGIDGLAITPMPHEVNCTAEAHDACPRLGTG